MVNAVKLQELYSILILVNTGNNEPKIETEGWQQSVNFNHG